MRTLISITFIAVIAAGCAEPELEVLEPATAGGPGVARFSTDLRVRVDQFVQADVFVPVWDGGGPPARAAVYVHGGAVDGTRYRWVGERLARNGFVSIHPYYAADLPFFSQGDTADALQAVRDLSATPGHPLEGRVSDDRAAVMGHSLGGVVAAGAWLDRPDLFADLIIMASFPAPGEDFDRDGEPTDRVVTLVGSEDPRVSVEQASDGIEPIDALKSVVIAEGVSHYQFASDPTEEEFAKDGDPGVDLEEAHDRIFTVVETLMEAPGAFDVQTELADGVVVQ